MDSPPPPPPPPPHGENPNTTHGEYRKASDLPPGNYDIFIIPPHSSGSGFIYLPSLQCHRNSFIAGCVSTLVTSYIWTNISPFLKAWCAAIVGSGHGLAIAALALVVGVAGWVFGMSQAKSTQRGGGGEGGTRGRRPGFGGSGGSHSQGSTPNTDGNTGRSRKEKSGGAAAGEDSSRPGGQNQRHNSGNQHGAGSPPPNADSPPKSDAPPRPEPSTNGPSNADSEKERQEKERLKKERQEKESQEAKRREELRRKMEEMRRKQEEEAREKQKQREREAMERELRERREQLERELAEAAKAAREKAEKEAAEAKAKAERELREAIEKAEREAAEAKAKAEEARKKAEQEAAEIRARIEKEAAEAKAKAEKEAAEVRAKAQREAVEAKLREMRAAAAAKAKADKEAAEAKAKAEKEAAEAKAKAEKEAAEKEAAAKAAAKREADAKFAALKEAAAKKYAEKKARDAVAAKEAAEKEAAAKEAAGAKEAAARASAKTPTSNSSIPRSPSPKKSQIPAPRTTAEDDAYSFRPYDRPRRPYTGTCASSVHSESSYAPSQSTARTTPPPSVRGTYSTNDPDKVVIKGVYAFNNTFTRTPVAQLVSGQGMVTDGLVLRITTEGLFIDDDVRGVPQREWDVKAWTMKLVEVWCPQIGATTTTATTPSSARQSPTKSPFRRGMSYGVPTAEESEACLANLLKVCKDRCHAGSPTSACFARNGSVDGDSVSATQNLHVLRASFRDQEGKKYVFILQETEGWKVAIGLQRLRGGTQVRALGVSNMPVNECKTILGNLSYV